MKRIVAKWPASLLLLAVFIFVSHFASTPGWAQQPNMVPVLIGFNRQPGPAHESLVRGAGGRIKHTYHLVPVIAAALPQAAIDALRRNPSVTTIEPDGLFHKVDAELDNRLAHRHLDLMLAGLRADGAVLDAEGPSRADLHDAGS